MGDHLDQGLQLAAVLSNFSKACAKQQRPRESQLLAHMSQQASASQTKPDPASMMVLESGIAVDLDELYGEANAAAETIHDRGAMRALTWGKKVTAIHKSLLARYKKHQDALLDKSAVWVCEACGFIAVSAEVPQLCPICKAPASRFLSIQ